jgi:hypothetical protein
MTFRPDARPKKLGEDDGGYLMVEGMVIAFAIGLLGFLGGCLWMWWQIVRPTQRGDGGGSWVPDFPPDSWLKKEEHDV